MCRIEGCISYVKPVKGQAKSLPMMTTGTVGGCSCGRVVSSRRGMAAAWARAGTEEDRNNRNVKKVLEISVAASIQ